MQDSDCAFHREGPLLDIESYPEWAQDMVAECADARRRVVEHPLYRMMRDAELGEAQMRMFLISGWPVIEQFPQYMAMNLCKVQFGRTAGHDMARHYLIRNIRVEQNHADHWINWAEGHGVSRDEMLMTEVPTAAHSLSHWCWHTCARDTLPAAMAATNYAIEGVTGEWSALVCSRDTYENAFPADVRKRAMKWLRLHAEYDDTHPWEALEIICTIMGRKPTSRGVGLLRTCVRTSYDYIRLTLDGCLEPSRIDGLTPASVPIERRARLIA